MRTGPVVYRTPTNYVRLPITIHKSATTQHLTWVMCQCPIRPSSPLLNPPLASAKNQNSVIISTRSWCTTSQLLMISITHRRFLRSTMQLTPLHSWTVPFSKATTLTTSLGEATLLYTLRTRGWTSCQAALFLRHFYVTLVSTVQCSQATMLR